jgi:hypothetical protein
MYNENSWVARKSMPIAVGSHAAVALDADRQVLLFIV